MVVSKDELARELQQLGVEVVGGMVPLDQAHNAFIICKFLAEFRQVAEAAEYQGRDVPLNKPMRGDVKKYKVYVKNEEGRVVKVNFGDPDMEIRRDNPKARKNFRSRMRCEDPGPKWKPRYWACRFWSSKESVTDLLK